jgi:hypothetical protein
MSPLNEFLFGYVSGMAAGATAQVSINVMGFAFGLVIAFMTGACAFMGCLWLLWRGASAFVGSLVRWFNRFRERVTP